MILKLLKTGTMLLEVFLVSVFIDIGFGKPLALLRLSFLFYEMGVITVQKLPYLRTRSRRASIGENNPPPGQTRTNKTCLQRSLIQCHFESTKNISNNFIHAYEEELNLPGRISVRVK